MQASEEQADAMLEAYDRVRAELSAVWADQQKLVSQTMPAQAVSTNLMVDHVRSNVALLAVSEWNTSAGTALGPKTCLFTSAC